MASALEEMGAVTRLLDPEPAKIRAARIRAENDARALKFRLLCQANGIPMPVREYRFDSSDARRQWPFDFAWPNVDGQGGLALEQQGGLFNGGRHVRGAALRQEHEKLNAAAVQRWRVLFCEPETLCTTATIDLVRQALDHAPPTP